MERLRVIFMGTPELAVVCLEALRRAPFVELVAVVTQPDRPKGRELKLQPPPVKEAAQRAGLPVLQPETVRDAAFLEQVRALRPDVIVVAAFGQILPPALLALPRLGCVNVHTSLLPKYRGAAPIQWALLNDERETGVTIMKMDAGLDTGDILAQRATPILPEDNAATLHDRLAQLGAELLVEILPAYAAGRVQPRPQPAEGASQAPKLRKEDGRIDWRLGARAIWNRIRAFTPWPGAFTFLPAEPRPHLLKIWEATVAEGRGAPGEILSADRTGIVVACGQDALRVMILQREGGRRLTAEEFLRGHPLRPGARFVA
ncbi:MAG: methionyl-tRNA formyltransferase [Verrucomicrobiales bacterium]|nr:methionyl-tRNA formyltransferase [Verrucomicrobiales bacterium]